MSGFFHATGKTANCIEDSDKPREATGGSVDIDWIDGVLRDLEYRETAEALEDAACGELRPSAEHRGPVLANLMRPLYCYSHDLEIIGTAHPEGANQ